MLVRSQDNEKITDRIEFLIAEIPEKGWGVYQSERLFGEYSSLEKAIVVLDMMGKKYIEYGTITSRANGVHAAFELPKIFQMPAEEEIPDEE